MCFVDVTSPSSSSFSVLPNCTLRVADGFVSFGVVEDRLPRDARADLLAATILDNV